MAVTANEFQAQLEIIKNGRGQEIDIALVKALEMLWEAANPEETEVEETNGET